MQTYYRIFCHDVNGYICENPDNNLVYGEVGTIFVSPFIVYTIIIELLKKYNYTYSIEEVFITSGNMYKFDPTIKDSMKVYENDNLHPSKIDQFEKYLKNLNPELLSDLLKNWPKWQYEIEQQILKHS